MRIIYCPITADLHLLINEPFGGFLQRGVFCGNTRFCQRDNIDCSVPDRRETGLYTKILGIVYEQPGEIFFGLGVNRIRFRIAQRTQRDQTIQHRRKHRREAIAALTNALEHPALGFFERAPPQRANPKRLQKLQNIIESQKEIAPRPEGFTAGQTQIALLGTERVEFMQLLFAR